MFTRQSPDTWALKCRKGRLVCQSRFSYREQARSHKIMKLVVGASLLAIGTGIGTRPMPVVKLLLGEGSFEFGEDFEQITYQADIDDFKDRRVGILVDRDDGARILDAGEVLDRARDAVGGVELRRDDPAGLADLEVIGHVTGIDGGARGADGGAEFVG